MPTYILLSSLTPEGSQTLHKDPDRLDAVNKEITEFGCKVVTQYAVLGGCDVVTIVDTPDNETVAHMSVDLSSRGTVKEFDRNEAAVALCDQCVRLLRYADAPTWKWFREYRDRLSQQK